MKEIINIGIKGHLKIWIVDKDGERILFDDHNDVDTIPALDIIRRCISGEDKPIDLVACYKAAVLLASKSFTSISYGGTEDVTYTSLFTFGDFNDTLDEIRLVSSILGNFSTVTGLSITKTDAQELGISWTLTFNIS